MAGILLSASFFASCEEGESSKKTSKSVLSIVANVETRASKTGFVSGDELGLFLFDAEGNSYDSSGSCSNNKAVLATDKWALKNEIVLTDKIGKIYAYYPYSELVSNPKQISVTSSSQVDYLYSVPVAVDEASSVATLHMKHALSLIKFVIKKNGYAGAGHITEVSLKGIGLSGSLDAMTGTVTTLTTGNETYQGDFYLEESTPLAIGIIALPQSVTKTAATVVIDGVNYSYELASSNWEVGKETTYTLKIDQASRSLITVGIATIDSWGAGGSYEGDLLSGGIDIGTEI